MQPSGHYYYPHFIDGEMKVLRVKWCEDTQLLHGRANIRPKQLVPELILLTSTLFSDTQITASWHILQFCNSTLSHSDFYSEQHSYYPSIGKSETLGRHGRTYKFQRKKKMGSLATLLHRKTNQCLKPYLSSWKSETPMTVSTDWNHMPPQVQDGSSPRQAHTMGLFFSSEFVDHLSYEAWSTTCRNKTKQSETTRLFHSKESNLRNSCCHAYYRKYSTCFPEQSASRASQVIVCKSSHCGQTSPDPPSKVSPTRKE